MFGTVSDRQLYTDYNIDVYEVEPEIIYVDREVVVKLIAGGAEYFEVVAITATPTVYNVLFAYAGDAVTNGKVTVNDSGASEVWTGYAKGDYVTLTATNGTLYVLDERATAYGLLALTADDSIAANSKEKIFDTGYSQETDNANWWNTTTDRLTVPFACLIELDFQIVGGSSNIQSSPKVNGTSLYDINGAVTQFDPSISTTGIYQLAASDYVEIEATNNNTTTAFSVLGAAAKDESQFRWNLIKRLRA